MYHAFFNASIFAHNQVSISHVLFTLLIRRCHVFKACYRYQVSYHGIIQTININTLSAAICATSSEQDFDKNTEIFCELPIVFIFKINFFLLEIVQFVCYNFLTFEIFYHLFIVSTIECQILIVQRMTEIHLRSI